MATTEIVPTVICTADPVELDTGFALIPHLALRHEWVITGDPAWDFSKSILSTQLTSRANFEIHFGFAGPTYGVRMNSGGRLTDDQLSLDIDLDQFQAGILVGADVTITLLLKAERKWLHLVKNGWHSHLETEWTSLVDDVYELRFDAILVCIALARFLIMIGIEGADTVLSLLPQFSGTSGVWDAETGIAKNHGKLTLHPKLTGDLDLVSFIIYFSETIIELYPPLTVLIEVLKKLELLASKILLSVSCGPTLGIDFPVEVEITKLKAVGQTQTAEYTDLTFHDGGVVGRHPSGAVDPPLKRIGMEFTHRPGIDLAVGAFVGIRFLKVFAKTVHKTWDVFHELGLPIETGPYRNELLAEPGSRPNPEPENRTVVFHPPGESR